VQADCGNSLWKFSSAGQEVAGGSDSELKLDFSDEKLLRGPVEIPGLKITVLPGEPNN
jgi:hypothetical protein